MPCVHAIEERSRPGGDYEAFWTCDDCIADAVLAVVEPAMWNARHTVRGKCRYCGALLDQRLAFTEKQKSQLGVHRMYCRFYEGPLEHSWVNKRWNDTFGGLEHYCSCGGSFRQGGIAGSGDGSEDAEPICPNVDQHFR